MNNFTWLKTYFSPFKPIIPKLYIGKLAVGTPYFFPRKIVKGTFKKKKFGFDFVGLGWKTKWDENDFRFEYNPVWSFVFFKWQMAIIFIPIKCSHYWECWLTYELRTDKNKSRKERIKQAKEIYPCIWTSYNGDEKITTCYWNKILKKSGFGLL